MVPVCLEGTDPEVCSGVISRGHRLIRDRLNIASAEDYTSLLSKVGVHVDRISRKTLIKNLIEEAAEEQEIKASPGLSKELLEELTDLVESPSLIRGEFDDSFLDLPPEVLSTVMYVHQRYVPLYINNVSQDPLALDSRNSLLPRFLCICNGLSESNSIVKRGNERVLKARLADAEFFVKSDLSISMPPFSL